MTEEQAFSRADSVRARREKKQRRERTRKSGQKQAPDGTVSAPVLMRGVKVDVPVERKQLSKVRRRYDISLGSQGAEVRLPSMPFVHPNWRWLSGLLVSGLLVLLGMMWNHPQFLVQSIEVQGLRRLEAREIHLVLGVQNASIFSLDPDVMAYDLGLAFPEFSAIEVEIGMPNRVVIVVDERVPVLGWSNAQGMVLVDENGVSFPARGVVNGEAQPFPVVQAPDLIMKPAAADETGAADSQVMNPYVNRQLLQPHQVAALRKISDTAPPNAAIVFDPTHGMGWIDPAGWVVYFGIDGADMDAKKQVYTVIVEDLQSRNIVPKLISVEFLHAPYYRMER